jgi:DNA-binding GntR family transcriptional regulator
MTLRQKAYQAIKNKIIYFELKPGDKVLESQMARTLKMGRVPVREALNMLEGERLIVKTPGYGYEVARISSHEVEDYFKIRTELECIGATMLMERATEADINRMRKHLDKARVVYLQHDTRKIIENDTNFHRLMYRSTKSDVFYQAISSIEDKIIIIRAAALQTDAGRQASLKDHLEIMQAIEQKKPDRLHELIVEHMKTAPRYYEAIRDIISF